MSSQKVLYISQEITPYLPSTEMSVLGQKLPHRIQEKGFEVRTFMPKYGCINERRNQLHEVIRLSGMNLIIDDTDHPLIIKVASLQAARMQVYFIDNDDYFQHHLVTDLETNTHPEENDERIMFFARGVMETVKKLRWEPQLIHCSGWISALAPLYLKKRYNEDPSFRSAKVVYALFGNGFKDTLNPRFAEKLTMEDLTKDDIKQLGDAPVNHNTLSKLAMDYSDGIVIASPDVDQELVEYARQTGKPILEYTDAENPAQEYADFYNLLLENKD